jgi:SAM-dependent methyltransferase
MDPKLDITCVPSSLQGLADVISCSEVLEHVEPPISKAFLGLYSLLRPGGFLVISVPHTPKGNLHKEHFPVLQSSELILTPLPKLIGVDPDGAEVEYTNLIFHGGIGATLEYRVFSEDSLLESLRNVGFKEITQISNSHFFGIDWEPWSRTWVAKKPISL